jgi:glycosyltransferase involved in cell wall biosynthesis
MSFRPCVIVPTFDNPDTIAGVVESIRAHVRDLIVVDDGSGPRAQAAIAELRERGLAHVVRRDRNGGKGAAVKSGFAAAAELGYTHALQVDADGQHDVADIPKFLAAAAADPACLVLGAPVFDASAPRARTIGRQVSIRFAHLETGDRSIRDPLCGFRVYPLASALPCAPRADRMDFDPEIAVRMVWRGVRVRNLPTRVRYVSRDQGGVSHFQLVRDNLRISLMHSRLMCIMIFRLVFGLFFGQRARSKLTP